LEAGLIVARCAIVLSALLLLGAARPGVPLVAVTRSGSMTVTLPAGMLRERDVAHQLTSGLTTVFIVSVEASPHQGKNAGGVRADVRLDLWEEAYFVTITDGAAQQRKLRFASEAELVRWWNETPLTVIRSNTFPADVQNGGFEAMVKLTMLPFSNQEQANTQKWLARTLSESRGPTRENLPTQSSEILRMIVESSVKRNPLLERRWRVRVERDEAR
jgi:hypothetical protein